VTAKMSDNGQQTAEVIHQNYCKPTNTTWLKICVNQFIVNLLTSSCRQGSYTST
jgi:hypothetical protein